MKPAAGGDPSDGEPANHGADPGRSVNVSFNDRLERSSDWVVSLLAHPWWRFRVRPRDAELRKLLGRLGALITDTRRLDAAGSIDPRHATLIAGLLERSDRRLTNVDVALETVDELRKFLIEVGDERFVSMMLQNERSRGRGSRNARGARLADSSLLLWSDLYATHEMPDSAGAWDPEASRRLLADLFEARRERYRLDRARARMKRTYLLLLAPVLALLTCGFGLAVESLISGADASRIVLLAAVAGALGGIVSGVRRLRDEVGRIGQLRTFGPALIVQPLLGAMSGLVLLTVLNSGLLNVDTGSDNWANVGVLAFAAGFSEPFFIGVVSRITTLGDAPPREPNTTSRAEGPAE